MGTIDLLDCLGMLGMLGFLLHTISTSWDSWNWWKPDTLSKTVTFSGGKLVQLLLTCWTAFGFWGCLVVLLHTLLLGTPGTGGSQTHCQILPLFLVGTWCICY